MKSLLLIALLVICILIMLKTYWAKKTNLLTKKRNQSFLPLMRSSENIVIVFDLHGVVFRHDYKKMWQELWNSKDKWRLIKTIINPLLWIDVLKLSKTCTVPEAFIIELAKQRNTVKELMPTIVRILNAQKPHEPTIELMQRLKKMGYQLDVLSNIGEIIYRDLEKDYPTILSMFDNVVVTCAANGYISKPSKKMFNSYLAIVNGDKKPIFIDDKTNNIKSAVRCGIASIYYQSFDQMITTLRSLIEF